MDDLGPRRVAAGARPQGQRDHNERLILSTLQRAGGLPASELARVSGLSAQAVSVILRRLGSEGLVRRGAPQRGRVGKPRVPVAIDPDGALSLGLKIGRRSADLCLVDFGGRVRRQIQATYRWPTPGPVLALLRDGLRLLRAEAGGTWARVAGVGVAKPFEIWDWHEALGAPRGALDAWREVDLAAEVADLSGLPVFVDNDATAACRAELVHGRGRDFRDFAYFFVGSFVGGGVVLNHSVFEGPFGNAGAFGSLPARDAEGRERQLIDVASLFLLEEALAAAGAGPGRLWERPDDWEDLGAPLRAWEAATGAAVARAAVAACAVIDFEAVLIDGAFPAPVRARVVAAARGALAGLDRRGLAPIRVEEGRVGANARALGAATVPLVARFLLDTHVTG